MVAKFVWSRPRLNVSSLESPVIEIDADVAPGAVILTKLNGVPVTENEARGLLERYGAIEGIFSTIGIRERPAHLPQGMYVRFAYYLDCRDALRSFHNQTSEYRLQLATNFEPKVRHDDDGSPVVHAFGTPRSATDIKSIFVGNLPEGTSRDQLKAMFLEYGTVLDANVISKSYPGNSVNTFGFVEFTSPMEASAAANAEKYLGSHKLRVEPKEYSARRGQRLAQVMPVPTPVRTPRRMDPGATGALQARLLENNVQNFGSPFNAPALSTPPAPMYSAMAYHPVMYKTPTRPEHFLPAGLFSPSPPQQGYGQGFGGGAEDEARGHYYGQN